MKFLLPLTTLIAFSWLFNIFPAKHPEQKQEANVQGPRVEASVVASNLDVPWEIAWGPDNKIWITEQKGLVSRIDPVTGDKKVLLKINDVWHVRTAGLLGMALHEDMAKKPYVFLNYTFLKGKQPFSRLVRYTWKKDTLVSPRVLLEIPGNNGHNGSRLAFFKGKLYWATGDAVTFGNAQNISSLNGKILRLNIDGSIPADNPIKGSLVWALGFRNMQGMVFSDKGYLYTSEHGDATDDEINLIRPLKNYGWPTVQGYAESDEEIAFKKDKGTVDPIKAWTPTIAPAGLDYYRYKTIPEWNNTLLLVTLKGKSLRTLKLNDDGTSIVKEEVLFEDEFGRLRDICISPRGDVYISTSNHDWNPMGKPIPSDDRIIRISRSDKPLTASVAKPATEAAPAKAPGATLYAQYCASCHKDDGKGVKGIFPALEGSAMVKSNEIQLITQVLKGAPGGRVINGVKYDMAMPSFAFLKDADIAAILTYVRTLGKNSSPAIQAKAVEETRKKLK